MESYIVVNATALDSSGALSILKQFIENIPIDDLNWLVFIPGNISIESYQPNVRLEPIKGVKSMPKRLWWDAYGLNKWLKNSGITPIGTISLQNTGFRVSKKNIPSFIYYHQSIPFFPYNWNPFNRDQRNLWFYKNIYPFFVNLFLKKDTKVYVQLDFIRKGFVNRFHHPENKIEIYSPNVADVKESNTCLKLDDNSLNLFYPAAPQFYKNHRVIIEAVKESHCNPTLYLTTNNPHSHNDQIKYTGVIPFSEVCGMYTKCDALLFPSYIETFGLPLLEAAMRGVPIIAADLPYAREVLDGYEGVIFVPYDSPQKWANAIDKLEKGKRYKPISISDRPGWNDLFKSIKKSIE